MGDGLLSFVLKTTELDNNFLNAFDRLGTWQPLKFIFNVFL